MVKSNYPDQIDSDVEIPRIDDNVSELGADAINSMRDAIFAIQNTLGTNPQGNLTNLVSRINGVIDQNGQLKLEAISSKGLITLPITNIQISDNAEISESKLSLDYGTSELYAAVNSNKSDTDAIRTSFTAFSGQSIEHFNGTGNRHDGYAIDLLNMVRGCDDVESALNTLNNAFSVHENSSSIIHHAYGIGVNDEFKTISALNVQDALLELDNVGESSVSNAIGSISATAISSNTRGQVNEYGNLYTSTMALTIFQTEISKAPNIAQVMRPNTARITSKNIDLRALVAGESYVLRISAGGIDRDPLDINLSSIIPTEDINDIIRAINITAQACSSHYPISAYNTGGQLTIAHNMVGEQFTIEVDAGVSFSTHAALGFSNVAGNIVSWSNTNHSAVVGGKRIHDFKTLLKIHHNHTAKPLNTIIPGLGDLGEYGIITGNEGRVICNITNHSSNSDDNGTHYILAYPTNEKFILSADIQLGEFDLEIISDTVAFDTSSDGEIFDIFVEYDNDGYGIVSKQMRAEYEPISGINIKSIDPKFPHGENVNWSISDGNQLQLFVNGIGGDVVQIPTGFLGELRAYAPNNIDSMLFYINSIPAGGSSIVQPVTIYEFLGNSDKLFIGSVHHSGNFNEQLKFVTDCRQIGTSTDNISYNPFNKTPIQQSIDDLRNNGIVRGLDVLSSDGNSLTVRGGRAYVNGVPVNVETQDVAINDFVEANYVLLLDESGKFYVKSEYDSGYSLDELMSGDSYGDNRGFAIIAQFHTDGSIVDGYEDRRLIISNIDKRLLDTQTSLSQRIEEVSSIVGGSMWGHVIAKSGVDGDGYLASIECGDNWGFTDLDQRGFSAGDNLITTRRFEFSDPGVISTTVFKSVGLTHINIFVETTYTGSTPGYFGPFGASGTVTVNVGVAVEVGMNSINTYESYVEVKSIPMSIFPSTSVTERYVASIPTSALGLNSNVMFDVVPRIKISGSIFVDGGPSGPDPNPIIIFDNVRIVTSSYSIAGNILGEDGSSTALATTISDVL